MGSAFQFIKELFEKDRLHLIRKEIGQSGVSADSQKDYFRVRLAEMYIADERNWFRTIFPALGAITSCQFGNGQQELSNVIDPSKLVKAGGGTGLVLRDVVLCPTLPFRGGTVGLTAVLRSIVVADYLKAFIDTLSRFSSLLAVPQLSSVLTVAGPLAQGVQDLFATDGKSVLGYLETFDKDKLQSGYIAVVKADAKAIDPNKLTVDKNHLLYDGRDLTGFDYLLIRLEVFSERDDFESITAIFGPLQNAITQLSAGQEKAAEQDKNEALRAALIAPELTTADRRRVIEAIKAQYKLAVDLFKGSGLTPGDIQISPNRLVRSVGTAEKARERGEIQSQEAYADS